MSWEISLLTIVCVSCVLLSSQVYLMLFKVLHGAPSLPGTNAAVLHVHIVLHPSPLVLEKGLLFSNTLAQTRGAQTQDYCFQIQVLRHSRARGHVSM